MNRRGFLGSILAACAAPAIVRAESLMVLPAQNIWVPESLGASLGWDPEFILLKNYLGEWEKHRYMGKGHYAMALSHAIVYRVGVS